MKPINWVVMSAVAVVLAGCGAEEIASPGSGGNITINYPPPVDDGGGPTGPGGALATPAGGCPTIPDPAGLVDESTITGPTGTYRVCRLPQRFTVSTTLNRIPGLLYSIEGTVHVGTDQGATEESGDPADVTLTIQPGVVLFAKTGTSWLAVNRGNRISAVGTATRPIVFTSRDNVLGLNTDSSHQQWGGVVLMGRAPITDCNLGALPASCERYTEGDVNQSTYGGLLPADNSGTMRYVQIRYSGYVLSSNSELQSLTLEGVGSGTTISHIQSHNSSDDSFEAFGGNVDLRYLVLTGADDDAVDVDTGYTGTIQYVIAAQKASGGGDSMVELDSANALEAQVPRTHLKMANFTMIHRNPAAGNGAAMRMRGQANVSLANGLMTTTMPCLMVEKPEFLVANAGIEKVAPTFMSVGFSCGATPFRGVTVSGSTITDVPTITSDLTTLFNTPGSNNTAALVPTLTGGFVNGANETAIVAIDPKTIDTRFDTTTFVGAVRASDTWYAGWTCNSATANFGSTSSACTSVPSLLD